MKAHNGFHGFVRGDVLGWCDIGIVYWGRSPSRSGAEETLQPEEPRKPKRLHCSAICVETRCKATDFVVWD